MLTTLPQSWQLAPIIVSQHNEWCHKINSFPDIPFFKKNDITKCWDYQKQCQCYLTLSKKKHDIQKIRDCIRSNSEKRDSENKPKICVQVFKPTFHETTIISL